MKTLNIVGCGRLGSTLAKCWHEKGELTVQAICNQSLASAQRATQFIGAGQPIADTAALPPADITLIGTPDTSITAVCSSLAQQHKLHKNTIVFHCSGCLTAETLKPAQQYGCYTASAHPIHSFATPELSVNSFSQTICTLEGDKQATEQLGTLLSAIGGKPIAIRPEAKTSYHIGLVFASNYLVALLEVSLRLFAKADIERETALNCIKPILTNTLDNVLKLGTHAALTGPIARQDIATLKRHFATLQKEQTIEDLDIAKLYQSLGKIAVELTAKEHNVQQEILDLFQHNTTD